MVHRAVCAGSFDPITNGHVDILRRATRLFDEVTVAIGANPRKQGLFSVQERLDMLRKVTEGLPGVRLATFEGLLVDFCAAHGIQAIVKGLRAVGDFDYELQQAQMNHRLKGVETVFVPTGPEYSFLSSSLVKEVATYGGDVSGLVPDVVSVRLAERLGEQEG